MNPVVELYPPLAYNLVIRNSNPVKYAENDLMSIFSNAITVVSS